MAHIDEENIVIKLSEMIKDDACDKTTYIDAELLLTIETVVQGLVPAGVMVEVVKA